MRNSLVLQTGPVLRIGQTCDLCWRNVLHHGNRCGTNLRSWRSVFHGRDRQVNDTVGAEDDFGLIQEVSSLCPPLSPVPYCTILGIFGRIQEVSNCCPPFHPACITDRRAYVERSRTLPPAGAWPNFSLAPLDFMALMMRHKMG